MMDFSVAARSISLGLLIVPLLILVVKYKKNHPNQEVIGETEELPELPIGSALLWFTVGLGVLLVSAEITVWGGKSHCRLRRHQRNWS